MHSHNTVRFSCLSKVIGILSILLSGASYCPLSPDQPPARLVSLIEQVQPKCVLMHSRTSTLVSSNCVDISHILLSSSHLFEWHDNGDDHVTMNSIAYVIFTSGSTGNPKMVPISHRNFTTCIHGLATSSIMSQSAMVLQTTPPTFDIHIQEILGTLWLGGSVCVLRPNGNLDMNYLISVIQRQRISFIVSVPTLLTALVQHLHGFPDQNDSLSSLRQLCSIGK
jgi:non-ribosomal peptide synthetase component F